MTADEIVEQILDAFAKCGHFDYGENISMEEYMLQTAFLADENDDDDNVVVAALLHDFGHLICNMPNNTFQEGGDNYHEELGAKALQEWFENDIVDAVRLHVDAKRYLCAANPKYKDKLSEASITTMAIQGGPMNKRETLVFRRKKGHRIAIRIRAYDDCGKMPEMRRPGLNYHIPKIKKCLS